MAEWYFIVCLYHFYLFFCQWTSGFPLSSILFDGCIAFCSVVVTYYINQFPIDGQVIAMFQWLIVKLNHFKYVYLLKLISWNGFAEKNVIHILNLGPLLNCPPWKLYQFTHPIETVFPYLLTNTEHYQTPSLFILWWKTVFHNNSCSLHFSYLEWTLEVLGPLLFVR